MPAINLYGLIRTAEGVELEAERFYRGLERKFELKPWLACFWRLRAREEQLHMCWLAQISRLLSIRDLDKPAKPELMNQVCQASGFSAQKALAGVHTLKQAYQVAVVLEQVEIGGVMDCLFEQTNLDGGLQTSFRQQIQNHQEQVIRGLPAEYTTRAMQQVVFPWLN